MQPAIFTLNRADIHIHLIGLSGTDHGLIRDHLFNSPPLRAMHFLLGIKGRSPKEMEENYKTKLLGWMESSHCLKNFVLLALDRVYGPDGTPRPEKTVLHTANQYILETAGLSEHIHAAVSIHPYRKDATDKIREYHEKGAVLLKWIPSYMGFSPLDKRLIPVYDTLAEINLPLLTHCGTEHLLPDHDRAGVFAQSLRMPLERGVTVIAAHSGGIRAFSRTGLSQFADLCGEFPNLYGDTAALASPWRAGHLKYLLDCDLRNRLFHGSDFPVVQPAVLTLLFNGLRTYNRIRTTTNPLDRDFIIKDEIMSQCKER